MDKAKRNKWLWIAAAGVGVVLVAFFLLRGGSSSPAATGSIPSSSGSASGLSAASSLSTTFTHEFGTLRHGLASADRKIAALESGAAAAKASSATTSHAVGEGEVAIGGKNFTVLGQINSRGQLNGYDVGGGVPVYFGSVGGGVAQGNANIKPGNYAYTPSQYNNQVSKTPTAVNEQLP